MSIFLRAIFVVVLLVGMGAGIVQAEDEHQDGGANKENGGQLVTYNSEIVFAVPGGALDKFDVEDSIRIRYLPSSPQNLPARPFGTIWVGSPFTLQLTGWDSGVFTSLSKPGAMTIYYHPEELGGRSESSLRIVRLFDRWVELPTTIDTANRIVRTEVPYGGEYGLIARDAPQPAAPVPAPVVSAPAPATAPGVQMSSSIAGRVFYDKNGNGTFDGDDFPIASAPLRISSGSWSAETSSGVDGSYAFWVLRESAYTVEVIVGPEWAYTTPQAVHGIPVTGQPNSTGVANFGMWLRLP